MARSPTVFWGIFWVLVGCILLLNTLGYVEFSIWRTIWKLWPILLIMAGVSLILPQMKWWTAALIMLIVFFAIGAIAAAYIRIPDTEIIKTEIIQEMDDIEDANISLNFAAGTINISSSSEELMEGIITYSESVSTKKIYTREARTALLELYSEIDGYSSNYINEWQLSFTDDVPINLELDYGAATCMIDISGIMVDHLDIDGGASNTIVRFADYPTEADIDIGASTLELYIPDETGASLAVDSGVTSFSGEGLIKNNDIYYTKNYDAAQNKVNIKIDAGASTIKVIQ